MKKIKIFALFIIFGFIATYFNIAPVEASEYGLYGYCYTCL